MKILFVEWGSYGLQDMKDAFIAEGHVLIPFSLEVSYGHVYEKYIDDQETEDRLLTSLHRAVPDVVFSINYFPIISKVCRKEDIHYIAWNYDCPYPLLYSPTIVNPCNQVYLFDWAVYQEFHQAGIHTVRYLPLAANVQRLDQIRGEEGGAFPFLYDVSFVGSLYVEKNDDIIGRIEAVLPARARGYLKALIAVQLKIQGYDLIEDMLGPLLDDLYRAHPVALEANFVETRERFYGDMIKQRITAIERLDLLEAVAKAYGSDIFTHVKEIALPNVTNHGPVRYRVEMPMVFKQSKINLNITLRSIKSGIPLRAFDIMGSEGFLISNYQADFLSHFMPGEDFVYYTDKEDLLRKIGYYLRYEDERKAIAKNGHDKVAAEHTYRHRVREILFDV